MRAKLTLKEEQLDKTNNDRKIKKVIFFISAFRLNQWHIITYAIDYSVLFKLYPAIAATITLIIAFNISPPPFSPKISFKIHSN